jgi:hypothetical protein
MNKLTKIKLLNIFFQFLNCFNLAFAAALFTSAIYLVVKIDNFNSFTLSLMLIGFIITTTTIFSFCCTNKNPCGILISTTLLTFIFIFVLTIGFCIVFIQDQIVEFLTENLKDSKEVIDEVKRQINVNMNITKIVVLSYSSIIVTLSTYT